MVERVASRDQYAVEFSIYQINLYELVFAKEGQNLDKAEWVGKLPWDYVHFNV